MIGTNRIVRCGRVLSIFALLGPLQAQDVGFSKDFKVRLGYNPSPKDHLRSSYTGFGLNVGYGLGPGRINLEAGYFYQTGDNYFGLPDTSQIPSGALPLNPTKSMEDKRNELSGFAMRLSYSARLNPTWRWQAGLQLGTSFKHQYVGDSQSNAWGVPSGSAAWRDFYLGTPREGGLNPAPYGGVTWKVDKDSSLEFNLVLLNYQSLEFHHYAGTGVGYTTGDPGRRSTSATTFPLDSLEKKRRLSPHVEIAYVFHF